MKTIKTGGTISLAILIAIFSLSSSVFAAKFFRWIDSDGKIHYSYTLPPDASQQGYTKVNESGRQIEKISAVVEKSDLIVDITPQKTAAEKATEEANKKYDNYLLSTYLSADELTAIYIKKQKIFKDQVALYKKRISKLEKSLAKAEKQEKSTKNNVSKRKLANYIAITTDSLNVYREMILDNQKKLATSTKVYESDKARLIELLSQVDAKEAGTEG